MEDEEGLHFHDNDYYQNVLIQLNKPANVKGMKEVSNEVDASSPFYYLLSHRAMATLEGKLNAIKMSKMPNDSMKKEEARVLFLCDKQAKETRRPGTKGLLHSIEMMRRSKGNAKERALDEELLQPYRTHNWYKAQLIRRCNEKIAEQLEAQKALAVPKIDIPKEIVSIDDRIESARIRREQLQSAYVDRQEQLIAEKISRQKTNKSHRTHEDRVRTWLQIAYGLHSLSIIRKEVFKIRDLKEANKERWNACVKVQRLWRKRCGKLRRDRAKDVTRLSMKLRSSLGADDERFQLFKVRVQSADLIIRFLRDTHVRATLRKLIRMVKLVQRTYRSLRTVDHHRMLLVHALCEQCMYPLSIHVAIVANNRGLDLRNISNFENNQMKAYAHVTRNYRILTAMQTPEFHAYLRKHLAKIGDFHKDFVASNKLWTENPDFRRKQIRKLIQAKRKVFLKDLHRVEPMNCVIPKIEMDEIRAFMLGGPDPLTPRTEELTARHARWYQEQYRPKTPFRARTAAQRATFVPPRFMIFHYLSAEDIVQFFIEYATTLKEQKLAAATGSKGGTTLLMQQMQQQATFSAMGPSTESTQSPSAYPSVSSGFINNTGIIPPPLSNLSNGRMLGSASKGKRQSVLQRDHTMHPGSHSPHSPAHSPRKNSVGLSPHHQLYVPTSPRGERKSSLLTRRPSHRKVT